MEVFRNGKFQKGGISTRHSHESNSMPLTESTGQRSSSLDAFLMPPVSRLRQTAFRVRRSISLAPFRHFPFAPSLSAFIAPLVTLFIAVAILAALAPAAARADEPYAPSRDYDLQNIRTHLWFDTSQRQIRGEVTEELAALRNNVDALKFDSVALQIQTVTVDGAPAKFLTTASQLIVSLDRPAASGERHEISIRYEGQPHKGIYFILPDKDYPNLPAEIWTQGEAEDTRYYIPLYDYPNDRTSSEMILTVPSTWITVSNGQLEKVTDEVGGMKTWDWKEAVLSTYP